MLVSEKLGMVSDCRRCATICLLLVKSERMWVRRS